MEIENVIHRQIRDTNLRLLSYYSKPFYFSPRTLIEQSNNEHHSSNFFVPPWMQCHEFIPENCHHCFNNRRPMTYYDGNLKPIITQDKIKLAVDQIIELYTYYVDKTLLCFQVAER